MQRETISEEITFEKYDEKLEEKVKLVKYLHDILIKMKLISEEKDLGMTNYTDSFREH
jgi:hypothetical protein